MRTLLLDFSRKSEKTKVPSKNKSIWFDSSTNSFVTFEGGKPEMEWDQQQKRFVPKMKWDEKKKKMVPRVKEIHEVSWQSSDNSTVVKNWVKQYGREFDVEVNREESTNMGIAIDVDDKQVRDVTDSLDEHRIRYSELS